MNRTAVIAATGTSLRPWIETADADHHVMVDQPLAPVAALRTQFEAWQPAATLDRD